MNFTFPSTVYSTILITEAIYIQKAILNLEDLERWCVGLFSVEDRPSDSIENENLMHHAPKSVLN